MLNGRGKSTKSGHYRNESDSYVNDSDRGDIISPRLCLFGKILGNVAKIKVKSTKSDFAVVTGNISCRELEIGRVVEERGGLFLIIEENAV